MIWILCLCALQVSGETLNNVEIIPSVTEVQAITEYTISLVTRTQVPAGGKFVLIFPSDFKSLPQGQCSCTYSGSSLNNSGATCTMSGNTLTILNWFTSSFNPSLLSFTIDKIPNPMNNKPISSFKVYTKNSSDTTIDSRESTLTTTFNAVSILSASISTSTSIAGDTTSWTFDLTTSLLLASSGKILVSFPYWNAHLSGSSAYLKSFISGKPSCTGIKSKS